MKWESFFSSTHLILTAVIVILMYLFEWQPFDTFADALTGILLSYIIALVLIYVYRSISGQKAPAQKVIAFDAGGVYFDGSMVTPHFEPREGFNELLAALKAKGHKVVMFTNQNKTISDMVVEKFGLNEVFDQVFSSGELQIAKPAPKAFERVIAKLGVAPQNFVFVDDAAANVEGAKKVGCIGIVFESIEQVTAEFQSLGLL